MVRRVLTLILIPTVLAAIGALVAAGPDEEGASSPEKQVPDRLCLTCHKGVVLAEAPHGVLLKTIPEHACEKCHGPADGHIDDPWQHPIQKNDTPAEKAERCLACHKSGPDHVVRWSESSWAKDKKTCSDCHTIHAVTKERLEFKGDDKGYVGEATCRMCHAPVFDAFADTFHARVLGKPGGGCEACHGPGEKHANGALSFAKGEGPALIDRSPPTERCLTCHRAMPDRHAREMPVYAEKRPACVVCHHVHVNRNDALWSESGDVGDLAKKKMGNESCSSCHKTAIETAKTSVHAAVVADPERGCEACHGPAGAHEKSGGRPRFIFDPLKATPEKASELCLTCHQDAPDHAKNWKGGPLASEGLSCLTCHQAHGGPEVQGKPRIAGGGPVVAGKNVGSRTCAICHENPHPGIEKSPHASLVSDPDAAGCESCHGPGSAHVMKGGDPTAIENPARLPESERAGFCLKCHGKSSHRMAWDRGAHASAGLTCTTCHEPLAAKDARAKKQEPQLCFACHKDVKASFSLPNHHPLDRGAVTCTDCHDVHGEAPGFLSVAIRREKCFTCHKDKEGPFLYEHDADRVDGCTVCHQPHGSTNRRLLTHRRVRDLCIQCHGTPASHTMTAGSPFLNCLNCHGSIHGSYVDKHFFR